MLKNKTLHLRMYKLSLLVLAILVSTPLIAADTEFTPISNVPQDSTSIRTFTKCTKTGKHTKAMITILPNEEDDEIKVSTYPANLIKIKSYKKELQMEWNNKVAYGPSEAGIRIQVPPDQIEKISISADSHAQVYPGLTGLRDLVVSSDGRLWANLTSDLNIATMDSIEVSSDAKADIVTDTTSIKNIKVTSDGSLALAAPKATVDEVKVASDGNCKMIVDHISSSTRVQSDGDLTMQVTSIVDGSLSVSSDGKMVVFNGNGKDSNRVMVAGTIQVTSDGRLTLGENVAWEEGSSVIAKSDGRIVATECNIVQTKSDGRCSVDSDVDGSVEVVVEVQSETRSGTEFCLDILEELDWVGWIILAGIALCCAGGIRYCCCRRRRREELDSMTSKHTRNPAKHSGVPPTAEAYVIDYEEEIEEVDNEQPRE